MKTKTFKIPVLFTLKAESEAQAKEYTDRLMRHGFESLIKYEQVTYEAFKHWQWAEIRGKKC